MARLRLIIVFLSFSTLAISAFAGGHLRVVKSNSEVADFILYEKAASRNSDEVTEPVQRYKQKISKDSLLNGFVPVDELGEAKERLSLQNKNRPRVLLLANASAQDQDRHRLENAFVQPFRKMGADVFMLPMASFAGLNKREKNEFFDLLSEHFDLMISNGGDDIDPHLYGEPVTYSVDTNQARDLTESEVIRGYIDRGRGFFYGVCRGMQLTAVTYGMKMIQDIPKELGHDVAHGGNGFRFHDIALTPTKNSILKNIVGNAMIINGFSWHHQAVRFSKNPFFEVAGTDLYSQFPEALESLNGKVLLTQFHPEYAHRVDALGQTDSGQWGLQIMSGLFVKAQQATMNRLQRTCDQVI